MKIEVTLLQGETKEQLLDYVRRNGKSDSSIEFFEKDDPSFFDSTDSSSIRITPCVTRNDNKYIKAPSFVGFEVVAYNDTRIFHYDIQDLFEFFNKDIEDSQEERTLFVF